MEIELPDDFKCPISLEIMSDPVILSSGHTFDRSSIQRWLNAGHRSCPITKLPLPEYPSLIPNHALRSLISSYTLVSPLKPQLGQNPKALISIISSGVSSFDSKVEALSLLNKLCKSDSGYRKQLIESGAVCVILNLVGGLDSGSVSVPVLQEKCLSLMLNLSLDDDNKVGLVAEGVIGRIVSVLHGGSPDCRALAATILTSLAVVEVNKATIGAFPFAIKGLVSLLSDGKKREKKEAATALYALCSYPENRRRTVECGAVPLLIVIVEMGLERAVEVLGLLAKCKEGREQIGKFNGFVSVLIRVLKNGSSRGVYSVLLTLNSLCCHSEQLCYELIKVGVLDTCFGLMDDEHEKIRRNAASLVQILQKY